MSNFAFVSALIRGDWAIEEQFALNSLELIDRILNGTFIAPKAEFTPPSYIESAGSNSSRSGKSSGKKVMILPVQNVLMKADGDCGEMGMATMGNYIKAAGRDPECAGVVLLIDSPGGTVDGTEALSRIIKNSPIPVVAFIDGMAASAALWIASSARQVIASSGNDQVGSVGVMLSLRDTQPKQEKEGVRFHTIVSDQSPDKNKYMLEIQQGKYDNYRNERLNPLAQNFIDTMKSNRDGIEDTFLTGKMYFAKNAMGAFVDRIGSLEDAIDSVLELSTQSAQSQNQVIAMNQFTRINAVLGVESLESVDGSISLNESELDTIELALANPPAADTAALQEQLDQVQAGLTETETALEAANAALTAREARISELEAQVAELELEPGAESARAIKSTDGGPSFNGPVLSKEDVELFNRLRS